MAADSGVWGLTRDTTYKEVCTGQTGLAEAVRVRFDPSVIMFRELRTVFFATQHPTMLIWRGAGAGCGTLHTC